MKLSDKKNIFGFSQKEIVTYSIQFIAIFFITFSILFLLGLIPEELKVVKNTERKDTEEISENNFDEDENPAISNSYTRPDRVVISKIGVDSDIEHPDSQNVSILDEALKLGAVHYPGSGSIESGNIFLFGHSTGFRVVQNQAYKTFNGLNKLEAGDEITLYADGKQYIYEVENVKLVDENTAFIDLSKGGNRLTISTCNSFGTKQERWVVEAILK